MTVTANPVSPLAPATKRCWKCETTKATAEFNKDKSRADGLQPTCKLCSKAARKDWLARNPDGQKKAWAKWYANPENAKKHSNETVARARTRAHELIARYKAVPCADCKGEFITDAMEFDHRPGTEKLFCLNYRVLGRYAIADVLAEIEKCDVVCAICHRARTASRNQMGRK